MFISNKESFILYDTTCDEKWFEIRNKNDIKKEIKRKIEIEKIETSKLRKLKQ